LLGSECTSSAISAGVVRAKTLKRSTSSKF